MISVEMKVSGRFRGSRRLCRRYQRVSRGFQRRFRRTQCYSWGFLEVQDASRHLMGVPEDRRGVLRSIREYLEVP